MRTLKMLLALTLFALWLTSLPAHADGWQDRLGAAVIAAPNDGNFLGFAAGYQVHEHLWIEGVIRRDAGGTAEGLGASTDAQAIAEIIGRVIGLSLPEIPPRARVGGTFLGDRFIYFAYDLGF